MTEMTNARAAVITGIAILLLSGPAFASHHLPEESMPPIPVNGIEASGFARLLLDFGDLDALASYSATYETDRSILGQSFMAGGYYRVHPNLKLGAFYELAFGQRHDDDWIEIGEAWLWRDTSGRLEHTFIADVTPRFLVPFLPGESWVFSLKNRYELTVYDQDETVTRNTALIRPGLTWFFVRDREPVINVSVQYATYLSLDFGSTWWYRHGPYASVIYHLTPFVLLDLQVGTQWIYWSDSAEFLADFPTSTYDMPIYRPWLINLGVIVRPRA